MLRLNFIGNVGKITKPGVATGTYMRNHGMQKNDAEISAINDRAMQEKMGAPDSLIKEWEGRTQKITESGFLSRRMDGDDLRKGLFQVLGQQCLNLLA